MVPLNCYSLFVVLALEALFGPDFDLVTSARFLPKTILGIFLKSLYIMVIGLDGVQYSL